VPAPAGGDHLAARGDRFRGDRDRRAFPADVRGALLRKPVRSAPVSDGQGLTDTVVVEGSIGRDARAIGVRRCPCSRPSPWNHDVLFKIDSLPGPTFARCEPIRAAAACEKAAA